MYELQNFPLHYAADLCGPGILDKDSLHALRLDMRRNSWPPRHLVTRLEYQDARYDILHLRIAWPHHYASVAGVRRILCLQLCGKQRVWNERIRMTPSYYAHQDHLDPKPKDIYSSKIQPTQIINSGKDTNNWHVSQKQPTAVPGCISNTPWKPSCSNDHWVFLDMSCHHALVQPEMKWDIAVRIRIRLGKLRLEQAH